MPDFENMLGRQVAAVTLSPERTLFTLEFKDGFSRVFEVHGDCCSESWIEHLECPDDVIGATLTAVLDSDSVWDATAYAKIPDVPITQDHADHDTEHADSCIKIYNTVFRTTRGDIVLEYRNASNGYYGGALEDYRTASTGVQ